MRLVREKHWLRIWGVGIAVTAIVVAGAMSGSCAFDSNTTFCEQYGLRCKEGQQCATNEPKCIEAGGCGDSNTDKNKGEMCDDGNNIDGDGCSADCTSNETCGNGIPDELALVPEDCDNGVLNGIGDNLCGVDCRFRNFVCGNEMVDAEGEQCDPGPTDSENCNSPLAGLTVGCKFSNCGDGYTNMAAGERCDSSGADTSDCNGLLCTAPTCGDTITNIAAGEQCDNGGSDAIGCNGNNNGNNGPGSCRFPSCGDGYTNMEFTPTLARDPEQCDTLGGGDTDTCNGNNLGNNGLGSCRFPSCGDGYTNMVVGEACDTLNGDDTDTCNGNNNGANSPGSCQLPLCGDGYINTKFVPAGASDPENCDNLGGGNTAQCNGNNNGSNGSGSCRMPSCGDGYTNMAAGEACDLGGSDTSTCNGSSAIPKEVRCQPVICGDDYVNLIANESCDNGTGTDTSTCNGSSAGSASCRSPTCGDGYVNKNFKPMSAPRNEECDPGDPDDPSIPVVPCADTTKTCTNCNCN